MITIIQSHWGELARFHWGEGVRTSCAASGDTAAGQSRLDATEAFSTFPAILLLQHTSSMTLMPSSWHGNKRCRPLCPSHKFPYQLLVRKKLPLSSSHGNKSYRPGWHRHQLSSQKNGQHSFASCVWERAAGKTEHIVLSMPFISSFISRTVLFQLIFLICYNVEYIRLTSVIKNSHLYPSYIDPNSSLKFRMRSTFTQSQGLHHCWYLPTWIETLQCESHVQINDSSCQEPIRERRHSAPYRRQEKYNFQQRQTQKCLQNLTDKGGRQIG